ncbi:MAG: SusD/RagB family nutrient-binding outer membrane lipoprotein [Dysgonomonas sp.]|jgi:hypothetical protein|uniref:SusD/RagB family nutrient-binding outer membrane lipoprotein n=1 Tax=Dysgonomonas termitidis TaxID=1516126 RepID=A0ABV9KW89_9BACT|nr:MULTISPECIES: SusD/RagB family nutrient-binding outer membrane lipoprotein [unclassified Dysgonomonas]MDR1716772.1 SusD/RagB family nutrient-binding outer membrane lipoprotein [Prevotella sp.]MDR2004792.1 SusD/RagB family nutrient-binding outer membrane lipoprotein [Prevotella sp.]HMM01408.1 SusD/RagB family nutrient-binding outer membrane lipoprotein [Dysgonomonas sp.]
MKTKIILQSFILSLILLGSGCTTGFDALNENPNDRTDEQYDFSRALVGSQIRKGATYEGADAHQRVKALGIDVFVQYVGGNSTARVWTPNDDWQSLYWKNHFNNQLAVLNTVIRDADLYEGRENTKAIARIWRVYIQTMFTDYFGPAPFSLDPDDPNPDYMKLDELYPVLFTELDDAVKGFDDSKPTLVREDPVYKGDILKWKRFANTLRLRMAIKLSEIAPDLCKTQALAAINADGGIMQQGDDAKIGSSAGWGNQYPYYMYQVGWSDRQVMMVSMEKTLTNIGGMDYSGTATTAPAKVDPRGSRYFDPSPTDNLWKGLKAGIRVEVGDMRSKVSAMSVTYVIPNDTKKTDIMLYVEACFLAAEATERFSVNTGKTALEWYEAGVRESFKTWGLSDDNATTYLTSESRNSWGTSAKYNKSQGAGDTNLEKIITQKYIAFYPDLSLQIWNDKRRLNLPALEIPEFRDSGAGTYPADDDIHNAKNYIQRTVYPQSEKLINEKKYNAGVAQLRDGDKTSSPLWWASKQANYCTSAN